jgi:hypothetical protein
VKRVETRKSEKSRKAKIYTKEKQKRCVAQENNCEQQRQDVYSAVAFGRSINNFFSICAN